MKDDEGCGRSKEVNRPELIGQSFRVYGYYVEGVQEEIPSCHVMAHGDEEVGMIPPPLN